MLTMQTQTTKTDIQELLKLNNQCKALFFELKKRNVTDKKAHELTGIYASHYNRINPNIQDLTKLSINRLFKLAEETKRNYDVVFIKLRNKETKPKRGCCADCGILLKLGPWHRTGKKSFCLKCWELKLI
jgi:formylmethanofuran dehydrogenase subunit E